ncbi:Mu-like prophage DNA circulation protein [Noviherbaspirillum humi]|uniref:Mu-like prophage DNA circulation protein n=1 Tax=Noviherbaspirillum humi TaxID=1688639 RepID=A0A239LFF2_9BURK|nr:DNA circularization N-terminal domain-containing protein [Noviherbaspirillum humi]SNT29030.1 Mu-like prophage DNA circulation protein [Noviherbaspirillum humi]
MAWRDNLRPASFRGVPFSVDGATLNAGRRLARHEYPQRDIPYMEDMGRKAREYKVEALIVGADYMAGRDRLLAAIEEAGPGQLVHPYYGTLSVVVSGDVQLTETTREGGMVKVTMTFVEAGQQETPQASTDTRAVLDDQKQASGEAIADSFASDFSVDDVQDFVAQDALDSVGKLLKLPGVALGNLAMLRANPVSALAALLPENLAGSLLNPAALARGILALVRSASDLTALLGFALPAIASSAVTPSRKAQAGNRAALSGLVQQAAAVERVYTLATTEPQTLTEARMLRAEIVSRADAVLLADGISQDAADAIVQLRTDAIKHFSRQTAGVPQLVSITPRAVLPSVVLAHDFYGDAWRDAARDADLVARNRVRHPGFVAAGAPLQFINE